MPRIINHQYKIDFEKIDSFDFNVKNDIVDLTSYQSLQSDIEKVSLFLKKDSTSRRAIIKPNDTDPPTCLISIQFLISNATLHVIANFRSQHLIYGKPHDSIMIKYLTTLLINKIEYTGHVEIMMNVGDFHF